MLGREENVLDGVDKNVSDSEGSVDKKTQELPVVEPKQELSI